eukprot:scaffold31979_cov148-Skeletonema_menzelii.AAC.5
MAHPSVLGVPSDIIHCIAAGKNHWCPWQLWTQVKRPSAASAAQDDVGIVPTAVVSPRVQKAHRMMRILVLMFMIPLT